MQIPFYVCVYIYRLLQSVFGLCTCCVSVCVHVHLPTLRWPSSAVVCLYEPASLKLVSFFTPNPFISLAALWYFKMILIGCLILLKKTWASCHLSVTLLHTSCDWVNWSHVIQTSNWILIPMLFTISHSVWIKVNQSNHFLLETKSLFLVCYLISRSLLCWLSIMTVRVSVPVLSLHVSV